MSRTKEEMLQLFIKAASCQEPACNECGMTQSEIEILADTWVTTDSPICCESVLESEVSA